MPGQPSITCPRCNGTKSVLSETTRECAMCRGTGIAKEMHQFKCASCGGEGSIEEEGFIRCEFCGGKGWKDAENVLGAWKMVDFIKTPTVELNNMTNLSQHRIEIIRHHIGVLCGFMDDAYLENQTLEVIQ
ncbi:MAG: hypothetical protein JSU79_03515 [Dehalococcoidales bacterium]|nr:MAG: hypothetical protein JSU79_03515 [Dehalococcoidales bacterium]